MTDTHTVPVPLLEQAYGIQGIALHPLTVTPSKQVYRVDLRNESAWILRAYAVTNDLEELHIQSLAALLTSLEAHSYPAERVLRTVDGTTLVTHQGWRYLMTTYLRGHTPPYEPTTLRFIGAALGQLHALAPDLRRTGIALPPAAMRPAPELAYAFAQLQSVASSVPTHLHARYESLLNAVRRIDPCEDLPHVLIHNDCHPGNTIATSTAEVVFIDWEGAGWGAAVIDLGFLLSSCDTASPWTPRLQPNRERVQAVVEGYCRYHSLTPAELDRLADAMRFRVLVYGAVSFATAVREQKPEDENQWWWIRYTAAEEIADRARQHFAHYR